MNDTPAHKDSPPPKPRRAKLTQRRRYGVRLKELLPPLANHIGYKYSRIDITLRLNRQDILGAELAEHIFPVGIKNDGQHNVLWVRCTAGADLLISYEEDKIRHRINRYFGKTVVDKIRIRSRLTRPREKIALSQKTPTAAEKNLYRRLRSLIEKL